MRIDIHFFVQYNMYSLVDMFGECNDISMMSETLQSFDPFKEEIGPMKIARKEEI